MAIHTHTLTHRGGVTVLAHADGRAKTYANRRQAEHAITANGLSASGAYVRAFGRPFYVVLPTPHNLTPDELKAAL